MKRYITLLLAGLMTLSLAACGQTGPASEPEFSAADVTALVEAGVFSEELEELDADMAFALYHLADYGLTLEDLTEAAVLRSAGATCEEVAVLVFDVDDREEKMEKALQALEDYLQSQIDTNADYRPNEIPKLEDAFLMRRGYSFIMVVSQAGQSAVKTALGVE